MAEKKTKLKQLPRPTPPTLDRAAVLAEIAAAKSVKDLATVLMKVVSSMRS